MDHFLSIELNYTNDRANIEMIGNIRQTTVILSKIINEISLL